MTQSKSSMIQFILDAEIVSLEDFDPQMSVLAYVREILKRTGSHEGCAEGDCGACTIVIAELNQNDQLIYKNINACVLLLPMLQGKALFTVESLAKSNALHPVQQAMVDYHASQCGFCTPGFVMSLYSLYQTNKTPNRTDIENSLSGNLCRCTGYKPIIDAALNMHQYENNNKKNDEKLIKQLRSIQFKESLEFYNSAFNSYLPVTIHQLCELKQKHQNAIIVAGNTDVGLWLNKQLRELKQIIHIGQIDELKNVYIDNNELNIGAAVTVINAFEQIVKYYPQLNELARRFASQPVCNAATLVGNIANGSPIGDSMPTLIALNARIQLCSVDGTREVLLEDFYLGYQQKDLKPNEFVEKVIIPINPNKQLKVASYKVSKRYDQDISAITMGIALSLDSDNKISDCRIACGGMAAIPLRAFNTEQILIGQTWNDSSLEKAQQAILEDYQPLDDLRATKQYRKSVAQNLLQRFYVETTHQDIPVSVFDSVQSL